MPNHEKKVVFTPKEAACIENLLRGRVKLSSGEVEAPDDLLRHIVSFSTPAEILAYTRRLRARAVEEASESTEQREHWLKVLESDEVWKHFFADEKEDHFDEKLGFCDSLSELDTKDIEDEQLKTSIEAIQQREESGQPLYLLFPEEAKALGEIVGSEVTPVTKQQEFFYFPERRRYAYLSENALGRLEQCRRLTVRALKLYVKTYCDVCNALSKLEAQKFFGETWEELVKNKLVAYLREGKVKPVFVGLSLQNKTEVQTCLDREKGERLKKVQELIRNLKRLGNPYIAWLVLNRHLQVKLCDQYTEQTYERVPTLYFNTQYRGLLSIALFISMVWKERYSFREACFLFGQIEGLYPEKYNIVNLCQLLQKKCFSLTWYLQVVTPSLSYMQCLYDFTPLLIQYSVDISDSTLFPTQADYEYCFQAWSKALEVHAEVAILFAQLSEADRSFLMRCYAIEFGKDDNYIHIQCFSSTRHSISGCRQFIACLPAARERFARLEQFIVSNSVHLRPEETISNTEIASIILKGISVTVYLSEHAPSSDDELQCLAKLWQLLKEGMSYDDFRALRTPGLVYTDKQVTHIVDCYEKKLLGTANNRMTFRDCINLSCFTTKELIKADLRGMLPILKNAANNDLSDSQLRRLYVAWELIIEKVISPEECLRLNRKQIVALLGLCEEGIFVSNSGERARYLKHRGGNRLAGGGLRVDGVRELTSDEALHCFHRILKAARIYFDTAISVNNGHHMFNRLCLLIFSLCALLTLSMFALLADFIEAMTELFPVHRWRQGQAWLQDWVLRALTVVVAAAIVMSFAFLGIHTLILPAVCMGLGMITHVCQSHFAESSETEKTHQLFRTTENTAVAGMTVFIAWIAAGFLDVSLEALLSFSSFSAGTPVGLMIASGFALTLVAWSLSRMLIDVLKYCLAEKLYTDWGLKKGEQLVQPRQIPSILTLRI